MSSVGQLQEWYREQCNGDWEHQYGIAIESLDNPGWSVRIDLDGTDLASAQMKPFEIDHGDEDWIFCNIEERKFIGHGDPRKLMAIIDIFVALCAKEV